jgi:hypothetical protein
MRRGIGSGVAAALLVLVIVAGCGGSEASPSPSPSEAASPAATTAPAASEAPPTSEPEASATAGAVRMLAACAGVAVRTGPTMTDEVLVRVAKLTKVRVVETVTGDPYEVEGCGTSGADWIKIDRINGTSVKKLYDVPFAYAAAGFFE